MNTGKRVLAGMFVASLLAGPGALIVQAEDLELDLDASVSSVYVPAGSVYNFLGVLFSELQINGGIEIGNLYGEVLERKRQANTDTSLRVSSLGDPDYLAEFSEQHISIRDALEKYCTTSKQLEWSMANGVANVRSLDLKKRKKNPLDIVLEQIEFKQGSSLGDCRAQVIAKIKEKAKAMGVFVYSRRPEIPFILPDSLRVMSHACLPTGKKFENTKVRDILDDLVKPFHNAVWVSMLLGKETDDEVYHAISFGSWRKKEMDGASRCVKKMVNALRYSSLDWAIGKQLDVGTRRECGLQLYLKYRNDPEGVMKAIDEAVKNADNTNISKELALVRKYLEKGFHAYSHRVLRVGF